jgi:Spy/CpxP family protein refolding chaperone
MISSLILAIGLLIGATASAQAQQPGSATTPYAGFEKRPIKALSAQQLADLRAGRGMGLALAAELNGYPGPVHVLELARELELSDAQRSRVEALLAEMRRETIPLGERLIAQEGTLDQQFDAHSITPATLSADLEAIGATQAALRTAHLRYHLSMLDVLTPEQVHHYAQLCGYADGDGQYNPGGHQQH